jgi:dCTP diphosphatase
MTSDAQTPIQYLKERVAEFARERDGDQFHSPKNLSMALAVEAAEVMELFQWKSDQETLQLRADPRMFRRVREEIADVAIYLISLCNRVEIDLAFAVIEKLAQNARKYPANLAKGRSTKYTDLHAAAKELLSARAHGDLASRRQLELDLNEPAGDDEGNVVSTAVDGK